MAWRQGGQASPLAGRARRTRPGIKQGNSKGNYEKQPATCPTAGARPSARPASTPRRASRSTRGCRTSRRASGRDGDAAGDRRPRSRSLASRVRRRGTRSRTRRRRRSRFVAAIDSRAAHAIRSVLLDVQIQIAAPAAVYDPGRAGAAGRAVRRARALGHTLRTLLWLRTTVVVPPFTGATVVDLRRAVHLRLRGHGVALPRTRSTTARCRSSSCSAGPSSTPAPAGALQTARIALGREAEYRLPVAVWRETMDSYFPGSAWLRLRPRRLRPAVAYRARHALHELGGRRSTRCSTSGRRPELDVDPVRAIADAVLYEGYVLWPYRRSALKNQRRWTFGGVYPRAHSEGRDATTVAHADRSACSRAATGARSRSRVRFLHVVERQVARAAGGALEPVDELTVGGERHLSWERGDRARDRARAGPLDALSGGRTLAIDVPPRASRGADGRDAADGRSARSCAAGSGLEGASQSTPRACGRGSARLTVRIANTTPVQRRHREEALRRTFCSTHTVLRAERRQRSSR